MNQPSDHDQPEGGSDNKPRISAEAMAAETQKKWDFSAGFFDIIAYGAELRWGPEKKALYRSMSGKVLFVAMGTGLDIAQFPPNQDIIGVDISSKMLAKAQPRADSYPGSLTLMVQDVLALDFADDSFDQVFTACTFCSVPNPVAGLRSLKRVLKPGGRLNMFEHTGSRIPPFNMMLNLMNPLCRQMGPEVNRPTEENVRAAGFEILEVNHIYLDIVKTIRAVAPG
ncbi:MAG: class I SAM-dependent methyltransferase [Magnetococcales bacterium]|nr:class I SAM-dependent methyltransferase [Magnetococcales bacterium]